MHEMAIAQGLIGEVERIAATHGARGVDRVVVRIGALAGVEGGLLERAYSVARAGTVAGNATLEIEHGPLKVWCPACRVETEARADKVLCGRCGDWKVRVVEGEELLLVRLELSGIDEAIGEEDQSTCATLADVR